MEAHVCVFLPSRRSGGQVLHELLKPLSFHLFPRSVEGSAARGAKKVFEAVNLCQSKKVTLDSQDDLGGAFKLLEVPEVLKQAAEKLVATMEPSCPSIMEAGKLDRVVKLANFILLVRCKKRCASQQKLSSQPHSKQKKLSHVQGAEAKAEEEAEADNNSSRKKRRKQQLKVIF